VAYGWYGKATQAYGIYGAAKKLYQAATGSGEYAQEPANNATGSASTVRRQDSGQVVTGPYTRLNDAYNNADLSSFDSSTRCQLRNPVQGLNNIGTTANALSLEFSSLLGRGPDPATLINTGADGIHAANSFRNY